MSDDEKQRLRKCLRAGVEDLPVLPAVLTKLMGLSRTADDYLERVLELVEAEPSYAARVLAVANSALSGAARPITGLRAAIVRLGSGRTVDVVTALSVARVFVPRDAWEKNLWRHSIQVAVTASDLAERAPGQDPSPEEAYCAGLLHDIGRFIMFHEAPDTLRQVDEGDWDSPSTLVDAERAICGLSHAELGAAACTKWGLPASITKVVLHHHQRPQRGATTNRLLALVQFADLAMFPSSQPNARSWAAAGESEVRRSLVPKLPPFIGLRPGDLLPLLLHSEAKADATARLLGV